MPKWLKFETHDGETVLVRHPAPNNGIVCLRDRRSIPPQVVMYVSGATIAVVGDLYEVAARIDEADTDGTV